MVVIAVWMARVTSLHTAIFSVEIHPYNVHQLICQIGLLSHHGANHEALTHLVPKKTVHGTQICHQIVLSCSWGNAQRVSNFRALPMKLVTEYSQILGDLIKIWMNWCNTLNHCLVFTLYYCYYLFFIFGIIIFICIIFIVIIIFNVFVLMS